MDFRPEEQNKHVIDALPYVNTLIDDNEDECEFAMKLVDDELEIFPPDKDYLAHLPLDLKSRTFCTPIIDHEYQILENHESRTPNSLAQLNTEPPPQTSSNFNDDDMDAWVRCLDQMKIKIEYHERQLTNLDLMKTYGEVTMNQYLAHVNTIKASLEAEIHELEAKTQKMTWVRKNSQEQAAKSIQVMRNQWSET